MPDPLSALTQPPEPRAVAAQAGPTYSNPVAAGDHPDPSTIRVGRDFWAVETTSEWGPPFTIRRSSDLVNWRTVGAVFPKRPPWSVGTYWAPEIVRHAGRFFVYYSARRPNFAVCVAAASAPSPAGPYTDHGPINCDGPGAIDAFPVRDENGALHLLWKENIMTRAPSHIWAQRLEGDGFTPIGPKRPIMRNDAPWEGSVVEAPYVVRRGGWFYMLYAGGDCCTTYCHYAEGVARSRRLLGPWEKFRGNPILRPNRRWLCPGHGSMVSAGGRQYLLYHAYHARDSVFVGRQAMMDEVRWGRDGWPRIGAGTPSGRAPSPLGGTTRRLEHHFVDEFRYSSVQPGWQWPTAAEPQVQTQPGGRGQIVIAPYPQNATNWTGGVLARPTTAANYTATTTVQTQGTTPGTMAGLTAYGLPPSALGVAVGGGAVHAWQRFRGRQGTVGTVPAPRSAVVYLRIVARDGFRFSFWSSGDGRRWQRVGRELHARWLPPWDLGVRVGLAAGGTPEASATFGYFSLTRSR